MARICTLHTVILLGLSVLAMRSLILPAAREEVLSYAINPDPVANLSILCRTVLHKHVTIKTDADRLRCAATELITGTMDALLVFAFLSGLLLFLLLKFCLYRQYALMLWIPVAGLAVAILQSVGVAYTFCGSDTAAGTLTPFFVVCRVFYTLSCILAIMAAAILTGVHFRSGRVNTL